MGTTGWERPCGVSTPMVLGAAFPLCAASPRGAPRQRALPFLAGGVLQDPSVPRRDPAVPVGVGCWCRAMGRVRSRPLEEGGEEGSMGPALETSFLQHAAPGRAPPWHKGARGGGSSIPSHRQSCPGAVTRDLASFGVTPAMWGHRRTLGWGRCSSRGAAGCSPTLWGPPFAFGSPCML